MADEEIARNYSNKEYEYECIRPTIMLPPFPIKIQPI